MALFDKLKEKINKVVDVDKLSEMASKTVASVKSEVVKAVDPSVKEQERIEKEKALKEQEEQKRLEKEKAINDFMSSIEENQELDYIFAVLEKSGASASNFEKGVEHLLSKNEIAITIQDALPVMKKALFTCAFADAQSTVAKAIVTDYFMSDIVRGKLLSLYISFAVSREKGSYAIMEEPFIKALFGVAGHVTNYLRNKPQREWYQMMTPEDFVSIIEDSDVLKSYTDIDPFTAAEVREKWAQDLYNSPLEIVKSSSLGGLLDNEEYIDELYYRAYTTLCSGQEDLADNVCIAQIVNSYMEHLKEYYSRFKR